MPHSPIDVLTVVVVLVMGVRLADGLRHSRTVAGRHLVATVLRRIRWRHVWPVPLVLAAVLAVALPLITLPGLSWGWWSAIGGEGNPVFGSSDSTIGTVWEWLVPLVFICLLIPALPLFAYAEERMFRAGAESWSRRHRALKVLQFGMVHALIGIPIGAALALSVGGAYFMAVYLRRYGQRHDREDATIESAAAHATYNGIIVLLVLVSVVALAFGG